MSYLVTFEWGRTAPLFEERGSSRTPDKDKRIRLCVLERTSLNDKVSLSVTGEGKGKKGLVEMDFWYAIGDRIG
jgi:hypothetical protein